MNEISHILGDSLVQNIGGLEGSTPVRMMTLLRLYFDHWRSRLRNLSREVELGLSLRRFLEQEGVYEDHTLQKQVQSRFRCADLLLETGIHLYFEHAKIGKAIQEKTPIADQEKMMQAYVTLIRDLVDSPINADNATGFIPFTRNASELKECIRKYGVLLYVGTPGHGVYLSIHLTSREEPNRYEFRAHNSGSGAGEHHWRKLHPSKPGRTVFEGSARWKQVTESRMWSGTLWRWIVEGPIMSAENPGRNAAQWYALIRAHFEVQVDVEAPAVPTTKTDTNIGSGASVVIGATPKFLREASGDWHADWNTTPDPDSVWITQQRSGTCALSSLLPWLRGLLTKRDTPTQTSNSETISKKLLANLYKTVL